MTPDSLQRRPLSPSGIREPRFFPAIVAALVMALVFGIALVFRARPPDAVQPIAFNHRVHVRAQVDCLQCHEGLLDRAAEPLPTVAVCVGCHGDPPGRNREKTKLARFAATGARLEWQPLYRVPDHVFFSHARHVDTAGLECTACHADMPNRSTPPKYRRTMSMSHCIGCHERNSARPAARRATLDCSACHR